MDEPIMFSKKHSCGSITHNEAAVGTERETFPMEKILFDLPENSFLSPEEVASFLSMSLRTIYRLYRQGAIQGIGLNQSLRIRKESLLQYVKNGIGK